MCTLIYEQTHLIVMNMVTTALRVTN